MQAILKATTLGILCLLAVAATRGARRESKDGRVAITLPEGWEDAAELPNKVAQIKAKNIAISAFAVVLSEPRDDFVDMTLERYAQIVLDEGKERLRDRHVSEPKKLTVNGYPALQYDITASTDTVKLVFVRTIIESPTRYNEVVTWTTPSHVAKAKPQMEAILKSFREVPGADDATTAPTSKPAG